MFPLKIVLKVHEWKNCGNVNILEKKIIFKDAIIIFPPRFVISYKTEHYA